jgi:hypothetical protein
MPRQSPTRRLRCSTIDPDLSDALYLADRRERNPKHTALIGVRVQAVNVGTSAWAIVMSTSLGKGVPRKGLAA